MGRQQRWLQGLDQEEREGPRSLGKWTRTLSPQAVIQRSAPWISETEGRQENSVRAVALIRSFIPSFLHSFLNSVNLYEVPTPAALMGEARFLSGRSSRINASTVVRPHGLWRECDGRILESSWAIRKGFSPGVALVVVCQADRRRARGMCWDGSPGRENHICGGLRCAVKVGDIFVI